MDIQLLQKLGNMDQIAGIREVQCTRGPEAGLHMLEIYNAAGLRFTVTPGRCLDIYDFSYKGCNFAFHSKNGLNCERNPAEDAFFHQWPGGMLSTCGLANVGDACEDGGAHPVHGRIGGTPARHVSVSEGWEGDDYILRVGAEFWETRLYGRQLSLLRTISTSLYGKSIVITDTIANHTAADEEFMLLYHINFGYPLLDASSIVLCPPSTVQARNVHSLDWAHMCAPSAQPGHQMFLHTPQGETASAAVANPSAGLGGFIAYETGNLPYLGEWKHMAPHDYVVALEPSNCIGLGRVQERRNGTLRTLPAYGSITHSLTLGVLDGEAEIRAFSQTLTDGRG